MKRLLHTGIIAIFLITIGYIVDYAGYMDGEVFGLLSVVLFTSLIMIGLWRRRRLLHSPFKKIDQMSGEQFEKYLMVQFKRKGYRVKLTPVTGDFGADLIMRRRRNHFVVQAKRYKGAVGIKAVQEVIGAMQYYDIENGMVVTNSYFTKAARQLAEASEVELWDRNDLREEFQISK